jgi:mRNA interferase MazF
MPPIATYSPGDVVIVPFPFTDRAASKRRPALVCSSHHFNATSKHLVLAMITSATHYDWPGDVPIRELAGTGLSAASVVRWKLFTLDRSYIIRRAGALSPPDRAACRAASPVEL